MKLIKKSFAIIILSLFPMPWNEFFQGNLSHFPGMECANSKRCLIWVSRRESLKLTSLPWKLVDLENDLLITFPFKVSLASAVVLLLMEDIRKSPVEVGSLSHYLQGFKHPRWFRISSINSFILPFKLSSYVFWVCSNCGAFAWHSSNKQRSPSHHERQMFQVFMGPKEKFSWNPSHALEGVELMGATLKERTNKFWMPNLPTQILIRQCLARNSHIQY